jgi:glutamate-1-semialdehyde 2,1-aminomutase
MLQYLKDHSEEVYPFLEANGEKVRKGIQKALDEQGLNAVVTGIGSLFQTHFPSQKGVTLNSPHSIHQLTDLEKKEVEFRIQMLNKGVFVMHGGGGLSIAHSEGDIVKIIDATKEVAKEMKAGG